MFITIHYFTVFSCYPYHGSLIIIFIHRTLNSRYNTKLARYNAKDVHAFIVMKELKFYLNCINKFNNSCMFPRDHGMNIPTSFTKAYFTNYHFTSGKLKASCRNLKLPLTKICRGPKYRFIWRAVVSLYIGFKVLSFPFDNVIIMIASA